MADSIPIIAISNRNGGTGKTTGSVNLVAEFAALGQRVLLIDLDTQGHCAVGLGLKAQADEFSVHSLFVAPFATLSAAIRPKLQACQGMEMPERVRTSDDLGRCTGESAQHLHAAEKPEGACRATQQLETTAFNRLYEYG